MPFINSKVNVPISDAQQQEISDGLIAAASEALGKGESWVMLGFEDNCRLYFRGDKDTPTAYLEVSIFGSENRSAFDAFTAKACDVINKVLGVPKDRIYVKYHAVSSWGWNGGNF